VHKIFIRGIEDILKRPGLKINKICILIGGPDWPTSVLTGILKLNVFQMLLGTAPCIFLVIPCVLTGSFMLKTSQVMLAVRGITLTLAAVVQGGAGIAAIYFVQMTIEEQYTRLSKPNIDL